MFGVMLFQDASSGNILYRKFVKNETNRDYLEGLRCIEEGETRIKAVVCNGNVGLLQATTSRPVRMYQFHQLQIVRRLLTNNPHLPASMELLALMRRVFTMGKEEFIPAFSAFYVYRLSCLKLIEFVHRGILSIDHTIYQSLM